MATPTDAQILADANKRLGKKYKTIKEYLTDNGRLKETGESYKRRKALVENTRGTATRTEFTESGAWLDYITENYGWLVEIYNTVPEVAEIIRNGYINDETDVADKIKQSKWSLGLQAGEADYLKGVGTNDRVYLDKIDAKERDVNDVATKSGYTLEPGQSKLLAAAALKGNWDPTTLASEVGKSVVTTAKAGTTVSAEAPAETAPTGLQKGMDAASIKATSRAYGLDLSDSQVEGYAQAIIAGTLTAQQIKDQFRNQAKSLYPSLSSQLDSGSVDDATASYRSIAAKTLGVDPTSINFSDATKYGKLLTYQDPKSGESRLMNSTEWTQYLRKLPDWQKTDEAKNQYSGILDTIGKIFGKVG